MRTIIPLDSAISQVLDGVMVDLKKVPAHLITRLQVHFMDGEVVDIRPKFLAEIIEDSEAEEDGAETIAAIELDLNLERIAKFLTDVSMAMTKIARKVIDDDTGRHTTRQ